MLSRRGRQSLIESSKKESLENYMERVNKGIRQIDDGYLQENYLPDTRPRIRAAQRELRELLSKRERPEILALNMASESAAAKRFYRIADMFLIIASIVFFLINPVISGIILLIFLILQAKRKFGVGSHGLAERLLGVEGIDPSIAHDKKALGKVYLDKIRATKKRIKKLTME